MMKLVATNEVARSGEGYRRLVNLRSYLSSAEFESVAAEVTNNAILASPTLCRMNNKLEDAYRTTHLIG